MLLFIAGFATAIILILVWTWLSSNIPTDVDHY